MESENILARRSKRRLIAGAKLRAQAIERTRAHIQEQSQRSKTDLKRMLKRVSDNYTPEEYLAHEKARLQRLESV